MFNCSSLPIIFYRVPSHSSEGGMELLPSCCALDRKWVRVKSSEGCIYTSKLSSGSVELDHSC